MCCGGEAVGGDEYGVRVLFWFAFFWRGWKGLVLVVVVVVLVW